MGCLFCNSQEPNYKPDPGIDFICSQCVQLLLGADQGDLKRAYAKAIEKGYKNKAKAIESFLEDGVNNDHRIKTRKYERHSNRARIVRPVRHQKKRIERVEI